MRINYGEIIYSYNRGRLDLSPPLSLSLVGRCLGFFNFMMIDPAGKSKKKNEKKEDTSNEAIANAKVADNLDPYTRCLGYRYFGARN